MVRVLCDVGGDALGDVLDSADAALLCLLSLQELLLQQFLDEFSLVVIAERAQECRAEAFDDQGVAKGHVDVGDSVESRLLEELLRASHRVVVRVRDNRNQDVQKTHVDDDDEEGLRDADDCGSVRSVA